MIPTENYDLFGLAERLGHSVCELLTGRREPMSSMEYYLWGRYHLAKARLQQQARRGKG
jgi:hypothetical protein